MQFCQVFCNHDPFSRARDLIASFIHTLNSKFYLAIPSYLLSIPLILVIFHHILYDGPSTFLCFIFSLKSDSEFSSGAPLEGVLSYNHAPLQSKLT